LTEISQRTTLKIALEYLKYEPHIEEFLSVVNQFVELDLALTHRKKVMVFSCCESETSTSLLSIIRYSKRKQNKATLEACCTFKAEKTLPIVRKI
jgi:hypothetical protein